MKKGAFCSGLLGIALFAFTPPASATGPLQLAQAEPQDQTGANGVSDQSQPDDPANDTSGMDPPDDNPDSYDPPDGGNPDVMGPDDNSDMDPPDNDPNLEPPDGDNDPAGMNPGPNGRMGPGA